VRHLTDDEIQGYLDNHPDSDREKIRAHLDICGQCRSNLENYQIIAGQLNTDHIPALSPGFTDAVLSAIKPDTQDVPVEEPSRLIAWMSAAAVFILGIASTIYFTGSSVAKNIIALFSPANITEPSFVSRYKEYISGIDLDLTLVFAVALVLAVIALIDRMIKRRHKPVSFMI